MSLNDVSLSSQGLTQTKLRPVLVDEGRPLLGVLLAKKAIEGYLGLLGVRYVVICIGECQAQRFDELQQKKDTS